MRTLLRDGANINAVDGAGLTPLMLAAQAGCVDVTQALLDQGANPRVKTRSGWDALNLARLNKHAAVQALIIEFLRRTAPVGVTATSVNTPAGVRLTWPKAGYYKAGQAVQYSPTAGRTWVPGVVSSVSAGGYALNGVTGLVDPSFVVGAASEPFWTAWFVGDWRVRVPAMVDSTPDAQTYRTSPSGVRLPPLRISADRTYTWRVTTSVGDQFLTGTWTANPAGPGVILRRGPSGQDWLVHSNTRTGAPGDTVVISGLGGTYYDGARLP